jgi:hypothetical protein
MAGLRRSRGNFRRARFKPIINCAASAQRMSGCPILAASLFLRLVLQLYLFQITAFRA